MVSGPSGAAFPHCGKELSGDVNREHVFGTAFGGHATVRAHAACNSRWDREVENRLHAPNAIGNLLRLVHGLHKVAPIGTAPDGKRIRFDTATGAAIPAKPPFKREDQDETSFRVEAGGTPEQLEKILRDLRRKYPNHHVPSLDDIPEEQRRPLWDGDAMASMSFTADLALHEAFAVKVALCGGVVAFGESFSRSPISARMRYYRDLPFDNPFLPGCRTDRISLDALDVFQDLIDNVLGSARLRPSRLVPTAGSRTNQILFLPLPSGRAGVVVHILGVPMVGWGVLLDAPLPEGRWGVPLLPILVREVPGEPSQVVSYTDEIMQYTADLALEAEREMGAS